MKTKNLLIVPLLLSTCSLQAIKTNIPQCCLQNRNRRARQDKEYPVIVAKNERYGRYLEQLTPQTYRVTAIKQDVYVPQRIFTSEYIESNFRFLSTEFLYSETSREIIIRSIDGIVWYIFKKTKTSGAKLTSFALAPTKGYLITLYSDNQLHIKSTGDGKTKATINGVDHFINGQHKEDESFLTVFLKNGDGQIWNLRTAEPVACIENIRKKLA